MFDVAKFNAMTDLRLAIQELEGDYGWLSPGRTNEELVSAKMDDVVDALKAIQVLLADDE